MFYNTIMDNLFLIDGLIYLLPTITDISLIL